MYDFPIFPSTPTLASWIYQGILFAIIFFSFKKSCLYNVGNSKRSSMFLLPLLIGVYIITSFTDGDFAHYQMMVKAYNGTGSTGLEAIYEYVIELTNQNYLLFRIIFFGGLVLMLPRIFLNYGLNQYSSIFFLFAVFVGTLSYSRASIGMALYFLGLSMTYSENRKLRKIIIGVLLIISSYFFHRSMIILIPMTLLGLVPINKRTIPIILGVVLLSFTMLKGFTSGLIDMVLSSDNEDLANKAEMYATESFGQFSGNLMAWIMHIWNYAVFYVLFFFDAYYVLNKKNNIPKSIYGVFNVSFGILLFAVLMNFFNMTSSAFYYRYLFMLMIPLTIMTTYLYQKGIMPYKRFLFLFWFGCIPTMERIVYYIYYLTTH